MAVPLQDWKEKSLGDLLEFKNGFNADASQYGLGIPFASVLDALQSTPMTEKTIKGKVQVQLLTVFPFCLKKGDLVFMRSSETLEEVGWSNVYNGKDWQALFGGFVIRGRPKVEVDSVFLNYLLRLPQYRERVINEGAGAVHYNIGQRGLARVKIPLPPLPEQHRIAEKLGTVDKLIDNLTRRIEKKRQVKQAVMQELLTGKKRLPGFEGEWEEKRLEDYCEIIMGQSPPSRYYNTRGAGVPLIQGNADIKDRHSIVRIYTTEITKMCQTGDVLMSVRAPVGAVGRASFQSCLGRGMCAFKTSTDFLYHFLVFAEDKWGEHSKGSTFDSISSNELAAYIICVPPTQTEEQSIAEVFNTMDASIAKLEAKRAKCEDIKRGLMHDLLTGKVRV